MIYKRKEGEEIKNGINYYPLNDNNSRGFIVKLFRIVWRVRYSTNAKKWFFTLRYTDPNALEKLKMWEALHGVKHE